MKVNLSIALGMFALLGPWIPAAEQRASSPDRAAQRQFGRCKAELAEAKEDLEAAKRGTISLRITQDEQRTEHFGEPPDYTFRSEDAKTLAILKRQEAVRRAEEVYRLTLTKLSASTGEEKASTASAAGDLGVDYRGKGSLMITEVRDDASLRKSLQNARPGEHIRIAAGRYRAGVWITTVQGTAQQPIVIEGSDANNPPLFEGGVEAMHFARCNYFTLRNIAVRGQTANGISIDDGGVFDVPAHHVLIEKIHVMDTGPWGNHDAIKLSGLDDFIVRDCRVDGWGGQSIDMVGCHRGLIENCTFQGKKGFSQDTGPQCKGGSSEVTIRRCLFLEGGVCAVNIGGATDLQLFRPRHALYEAKQITIEGCTFTGSDVPVAFIGVDGAVFRYNTVYHPRKWVMRILQETNEKGFIPCRNGRFEHNLVVFRRADVRDVVNIGPNTRPKTFRFADNLWFCEDHPEASKPVLPTPETGGVYGIDPRLQDPARDLFRPRNSQVAAFGADAWKPDIPSEK
jgi:hypothetical protein